MKKQIVSALCALAILVTSVITALAAPHDEAQAVDGTVAVSETPGVGISVEDGVIGFATGFPAEVNNSENNSSTVSSIGYYPFEIQYVTHNGAPVIIKSFRVPAGFDPAVLVEADFEDTGSIMYSNKDILKNELPPTLEQRMEADQVTVMTDSDDMETLLAAFPMFLDYSVGGFAGKLELDVNSIQSRATDKEVTSHPVRRTAEYNNLDRNDLAYIPKTLGNLTLADVKWTPMGGSQRGDEIIPSYYNALATYTGTGYGENVTG